MSWHPAIHATENPGGNAVGAVRVLTLGAVGRTDDHRGAGGAFRQGRRYAYRILEVDPAVLPVVELRLGDRRRGGGRRQPGALEAALRSADGVTDAAALGGDRGVYAGGLEALGTAFGG